MTAFDDLVVIIDMLDNKIKVKKAIHLIVKGMVEGEFLGIFIGMFALLLFIKWAEDNALEKLNKFKEIIK